MKVMEKKLNKQNGNKIHWQWQKILLNKYWSKEELRIQLQENAQEYVDGSKEFLKKMFERIKRMSFVAFLQSDDLNILAGMSEDE